MGFLPHTKAQEDRNNKGEKDLNEMKKKNRRKKGRQ